MVGGVAAVFGGALCLPFGVVAVGFGWLSRRRIHSSGGSLTGDGVATAGLILGVLEIVVGAALVALYIYLSNTMRYF